MTKDRADAPRARWHHLPWPSTVSVWRSRPSGEARHDRWLAADLPAVMPGRNGENVAGVDLKCGAIVHEDDLATGQHVPLVGRLAPVRLSNKGRAVHRGPVAIAERLARRKAYSNFMAATGRFLRVSEWASTATYALADDPEGVGALLHL